MKILALQPLLVTATVSAVAFGSALSAHACLSDYCANRKTGASVGSTSLRYGGTYSQAGADRLNYRYGYGTGRNRDFYNVYSPGTAKFRPSKSQSQKTVKPQPNRKPVIPFNSDAAIRNNGELGRSLKKLNVTVDDYDVSPAFKRK